MIKTIIFDWAGVLTVGRYTRSILNILEKREGASLNKIYSQFDDLIVKMGMGDVSFQEFVNSVNNKFGIKIKESEMFDVFGKAIIPNKEVIDIAKGLQARYNLILMSDNEETTVKILKKEHKEMLGLFKKLYFSYELGIKKPDPKFYKRVLEDSNLNPSECVFIDDKEKNIESARKFGINGILFLNINQLKKELLDLGVSFN